MMEKRPIKDHRKRLEKKPRVKPEDDIMIIARAVLGPQFGPKEGPANWGIVEDGASVTGLAVQSHDSYFIYERSAIRHTGETEAQMGLKRVKFDPETGLKKSVATQALRHANEEFNMTPSKVQELPASTSRMNRLAGVILRRESV